MSVMTISRETGSGGRYIAEKVAQTLGYRLVDKNAIGRIYGRYCGDEFGMDVGYIPDFWNRFDLPTDERRGFMVDALNRVILALAHHDNIVIVGRSGFAVLAQFADVLNVRIQAPLPIRIKRVMERRNISSPDQAEALVRESDRVRAAFVEEFYGKRWDTSKSFDVVIDTGKISEELATSWLAHAVKGLQAQSILGVRAVGTIQVEPGLPSIISEELNFHAVHR